MVTEKEQYGEFTQKNVCVCVCVCVYLIFSMAQLKSETVIEEKHSFTLSFIFSIQDSVKCSGDMIFFLVFLTLLPGDFLKLIGLGFAKEIKWEERILVALTKRSRVEFDVSKQQYVVEAFI